MARTRKTIEVETIKGWVNGQLARKDQPVEARRALCNLLEIALFEAGAYSGFNDVYWMSEGGYEQWREAGSPDFPEKYRFIHGTKDGEDLFRRRYY
jgi:hypothetical protein